jgi:hypothetical protein
LFFGNINFINHVIFLFIKLLYLLTVIEKSALYCPYSKRHRSQDGGPVFPVE